MIIIDEKVWLISVRGVWVKMQMGSAVVGLMSKESLAGFSLTLEESVWAPGTAFHLACLILTNPKISTFLAFHHFSFFSFNFLHMLFFLTSTIPWPFARKGLPATCYLYGCKYILSALSLSSWVYVYILVHYKLLIMWMKFMSFINKPKLYLSLSFVLN